MVVNKYRDPGFVLRFRNSRSVKLTTANVEGHFMLSQLYFTVCY